MDKILSEFGVQPVLLAAQVVNFLILLFILKKFLYKPILKVLDQRKELIVKTLKNAEDSEKVLLETGEKADKITAKAIDEARQIIDEANKAGVVMLEDTKKAAAEIIQKANEQALELIQTERINLKQEIRENLGSMITLALEKVTGKVLTQKEKEAIVEKEIKNIS